jgi:glycosyltransferase involved in cell wall biosynthesis
MHIVIFEVALSGHHANYLSHLATLFLSQGHRISVTLLEEHHVDPVIVELLGNFPDRFKLIPLREGAFLRRGTKRLGVVGSELKCWLMFRQAFKRLQAGEQVDQVFFPYLDYCLHAIALLGSPCGSVPWSGICMRPSFHYHAAGVLAPIPKWRRVKAWLFRKLLGQRSLKTLFTIDELLEQQVHLEHPTITPRLVYVPDPAELSTRHNQASARNLFRLAQDDFVILVYGAIDPRKGIDQLLQGVRGQQLARKVRILVAGRHTPALREQLCHEHLVTSIDGYADSETEEAAFRAADAVWMGYRAHYVMSGVLVLAAFAGKPVIATRNGLIGWMTQQHSLGMAIDCEDPAKVNAAVRNLINQATWPPSMGMAGIQQRHSWHEFNRIILQGTASEPEH